MRRRAFLRRGGAVAAALVAGNAIRDDRAPHLFSFCRTATAQALTEAEPAPSKAVVRSALDPTTLAPFVDRLPLPPAAGIAGFRPSPVDPSRNLPYYRIEMRESRSQVHRDLEPTRIWGYEGSSPGPVIETRKGHGVLVEWANELPARHFLPIDPRLLPGGVGVPEVRTVVHLHGAKTPPGSDGYPEHWYAPGASRLYHYPSEQDACMLWYHDHAMGINRLNVYAGLLGLFVIRDDVEDALALPRDDYELPLVLYDRMLDAGGQLLYPVSPIHGVTWVPELFADTTLVNGKLFPYHEVEARPYRLRVLNASNSRIYQLSLSGARAFHQIGTDRGLLSHPVEVRRVSLAPAERADLIVDFARCRGERLELTNGPVALMQFRVSSRTSAAAAALPDALRPIEAPAESTAVTTRVLTLDEEEDLVGNPVTILLNGARWEDPVTERPVLGTTEIWSFVNLTEDPHPVHLHLVRFRILDRRRFDVSQYRSTQQLRYTGPSVPPAPGEAGWKDTVRADAGMVTRIIVRFEGYVGRYLWHCHVLEHEDNDMMRPFDVIASV